MKTQPKNQVLAFYAAINRGSVDEAATIFREDVTYWGVDTTASGMRRRLYVGREEVVAYLKRFIENMHGRPLHYELPTLVGDEKFVLVEWVDEGQDRQGRTYKNSGVNVFEFDENGLVVTSRPYFDNSELSSWFADDSKVQENI